VFSAERSRIFFIKFFWQPFFKKLGVVCGELKASLPR
jgi:hypothetical protein